MICPDCNIIMDQFDDKHHDPATTPATGGYTAYEFMEHNAGDFSESMLSVSGFGDCFVSSNVEFSGSAWQHTGVDIN